jgi:hypothetical protein
MKSCQPIDGSSNADFHAIVNFALTEFEEVALLGPHSSAERGPFGNGILHLHQERPEEEAFDG